MTPAQKIQELKTLLVEAKEALMNRDPHTRAKECYDSGHTPCECTLCKINEALKEPCPRCNGSGIVWGRCCAGLSNECGCMGLPVDVDCNMCDGTGKIDNPLSEEALIELVAFLNAQGEIDAYMSDRFTNTEKP